MSKGEDWMGMTWAGVTPIEGFARPAKVSKSSAEKKSTETVRVVFLDGRVRTLVGEQVRNLKFHCERGHESDLFDLGFEDFWRRQAALDRAPAVDHRLEALTETQEFLVKRVRELESEVKRLREDNGHNLLAMLRVPTVEVPAPTDEDSEFFAKALATLE